MKETDLTQGKIFQKLIKFSLPMIAGNLLQQIYNLVDTLIVGRCLGADALAAVGSAYTLMIFITSIIIGLCMGSGAFFSEDYGAGNQKKLKEDIWLSFWFILSVSVVICAIIYPGMNFILWILQTPKELMELTREYVTVVFVGIIFVFLYNFFAYLLRSMGNSFMPLVFLAISSVLNIVLDIWFVAGLNMGVGGAALATVIAQAVSGLGLLIYSMIKIPVLKNNHERTGFNIQRLKEIIINDVATGIQQSVMNFGILMIQGLVNSFGITIMASFAAAVKIDTIAYMPAQEFGNAYSLFVSQNYGADEKDRIRKGTHISFVISALFCVVISLMIFIFAENLMRIFIDADEIRIIAEGTRYLKIEGSMYVGIGVLFLWYGYFRGINKPHYFPFAYSYIIGNSCDTILHFGTSYTIGSNGNMEFNSYWLGVG